MGFFGFLKKAVGSIAHAIPGVGTALDIVGGAAQLLQHKAPMGSTNQKIMALGKFRQQTGLLRGNATQSMPSSINVRGFGGATVRVPLSPAILRQTPQLPGGAVATPGGPVAATGGAPPTSYGGGRRSGSGGKRRKKRSTSHARSTKKRRSGGRRLKFGSPAWRKKYMKKRR